MGRLIVTFIDVGWGDSILIETWDDAGNVSIGLIDSNDTTFQKSSLIFLKKRFYQQYNEPHFFDFVIMSHAHSDHSSGLQSIFSEFGTKHFWFPNSNLGLFTALLRYSNRYPQKVQNFQDIDNTTILPNLNNLHINVLWPPPGVVDPNENNNSIVLSLTFQNISIILGGDAEGNVWNGITNQIPVNTVLFKVPHHGALNGTFVGANPSNWVNRLSLNCLLAISTHKKPHGHPDQQVINLFNQRNISYLRTDENYHISFITDGYHWRVKYSH